LQIGSRRVCQPNARIPLRHRKATAATPTGYDPLQQISLNSKKNEFKRPTANSSYKSSEGKKPMLSQE